MLAAGLDLGQLDQMLESLGEIRLASGEVLSPAQFKKTLDDIRAQGYAAGVSQRELGAASVSVPVFDRTGALRAALQLSGLAEDFERGRVEGYVGELKRASAAITRRIP